MNEEKEQINYNEFALDPKKDVLVPVQIWSTLFRVIRDVEAKLCKVETQDKYSWYKKDTLQPISEKARKTITKEKLEKDYIKQIDLVKTKNNRVVTRDENGLSLAALELLGAFDHVFKYNIDNGNKVPLPMPTNKVAEPDRNISGPTLVEDDVETEKENES